DGELLFLFGKVSFRARQPPSHDVESREILRSGRDPLQRFSRKIDLTKPQRRGSKIELTVDVIRLQAGDLCTPRNRFLRVLFFGGFGKNVKSVKRIATVFENLTGQSICDDEIFLLQSGSRALQQTRFMKPRVGLGAISTEKNNQQ